MKTIFSKKLRKRLALGAVILAIPTVFAFKDDFFEISKNIEIFTSLYRDVNIYYVDETQPGELMKTAIDGMLASLDPYTVYIPESRIEDYRFMTSGQYGGIGATIRKIEDRMYITEPYENYPAYESGLRAGDEILSIDGKPLKDLDSDEVSQLLKGQSGTKLTVEYIPLGEEKAKKVTFDRQTIKVNDVPFSGMLNDKTGYIKLVSFTETASAEVKEAFIDLKDKGMKQLVFDLRGNGGGLLREAVNIVNFFVPKGSLVVDTRGKIEEWNQKYFAQNNPIDLEMPIVILVDGHSASASEIVAGSLQDYDRAVIVGATTYGKGLVQQTKDLYFNSKLKVTVAKYYIPSGRCIQKLDYAHRDETGVVTEVPDSLLKEFKTSNGRVVMDGRGIEPDIHVDDEEIGHIIGSLFNNAVFFEYANNYRKSHPEIASAKAFSLTDEEYNALTSLALSHDLKYSTRTERLIEGLEKSAQQEKYLQFAEAELAALKEKLLPDPKKDVARFKNQIKQLAENEIIARYYFQKGRVEASLNGDPVLAKGLEYLADEKRKAVLKGK